MRVRYSCYLCGHVGYEKDEKVKHCPKCLRGHGLMYDAEGGNVLPFRRRRRSPWMQQLS